MFLLSWKPLQAFSTRCSLPKMYACVRACMGYLPKFRVRFVCAAPIKGEIQRATGTREPTHHWNTAMFLLVSCFALVASVLGKYINFLWYFFFLVCVGLLVWIGIIGTNWSFWCCVLEGCGVPSIRPQVSGYNKIVNGETAVSGSWPWQVSLQVDNNSPICTFCLAYNPFVIPNLILLPPLTHRMVQGSTSVEDPWLTSTGWSQLLTAVCRKSS